MELLDGALYGPGPDMQNQADQDDTHEILQVVSPGELEFLQPKGRLFLTGQMGLYEFTLHVGVTILPPLQPIAENRYIPGRFKLRQYLVIIVQYGVLTRPLILEDAEFGSHIGLVVRISIQVVRGDI